MTMFGTVMRRRYGLRVSLALTALCAGVFSAEAGEFIARTITVPETKAVFAEVKSRTVVPARARIGGTIKAVHVREGDEVSAGEVIAEVVDEKIALELEAAHARIEALRSQLDNARTELERVEQLVERGSAAQSRLDQARTQFDVVTNQTVAAESEMSVIRQRASEGEVLAPNAGRVLTVPVTEGSVIMPGEAVARIASGRYFLRLSIPERHASQISAGAKVLVGGRKGASAAGSDTATSGSIVKVYPEISEGRVTADVEVDGLGDYFVNERTLVQVPVGERQVIAVPGEALSLRHGIDYVRIATPGGEQDVAVIPGGEIVEGDAVLVEILSGLRDGDRVMMP
ncbi:MAG: efflux RND transporter periplasmic adaptor subunit [Roseibium sp.]